MRIESNGIEFEIDLGNHGAKYELIPLKSKTDVNVYQLKLFFAEKVTPRNGITGFDGAE